jgi:cell wall-associated NlpC family hydrolase
MRIHLSLIFVVLVLLLALPSIGAAATAPSTATFESGVANSVASEARALVSTGPGAKPPVPATAGRGRRAVTIGLRYLGVPYRWGGASPAGFDCSGFVMYVYGRVGVALPHNGAMLWGKGRTVRRSNLELGDVVFFNGLGHVGIFIGRGRFVHSPHAGDVVKISRLSESWYRTTYVGARRYSWSNLRSSKAAATAISSAVDDPAKALSARSRAVRSQIASVAEPAQRQAG